MVARYHASLFPIGARVADLTCGIGADLIALCRRGPTVGYELDEERLDFAKFNIQCLGLTSEFKLEDSLAADWDFEYVIADPARRVEGRRTLDPNEFEPNPTKIAERMKETRLGLLKLSPAMIDSFLESLGGRLEFVSYGGECREALVHLGSDSASGRWAVHCESGLTLAAETLAPTSVGSGAYLYDMDPAAVRAHCAGTLCEHFALEPLGDSNGYLVGDKIVQSPWLRSYRTLYSGKGDVKATRKALRDLNARVYEIKVRGVKVDSVRLAKELQANGETPVSLVIWCEKSSVKHLLVQGLS